MLQLHVSTRIHYAHAAVHEFSFCTYNNIYYGYVGKLFPRKTNYLMWRKLYFSNNYIVMPDHDSVFLSARNQRVQKHTRAQIIIIYYTRTGTPKPYNTTAAVAQPWSTANNTLHVESHY